MVNKDEETSNKSGLANCNFLNSINYTEEFYYKKIFGIYSNGGEHYYY